MLKQQFFIVSIWSIWSHTWQIIDIFENHHMMYFYQINIPHEYKSIRQLTKEITEVYNTDVGFIGGQCQIMFVRWAIRWCHGNRRMPEDTVHKFMMNLYYCQQNKVSGVIYLYNSEEQTYYISIHSFISIKMLD